MRDLVGGLGGVRRGRAPGAHNLFDGGLAFPVTPERLHLNLFSGRGSDRNCLDICRGRNKNRDRFNTHCHLNGFGFSSSWGLNHLKAGVLFLAKTVKSFLDCVKLLMHIRLNDVENR
jgi:hypothetical protein